MVKGYISLAEARASQAALLESALPVIAGEVRAAQAAATLQGPGPIFLGIGASYAASAAAVWVLRSRGIHALRLNAGEHPLPFPQSAHPIIGVSQSGRSSETLAVLRTIEPQLRLAVVNVAPSPISEIAATTISLGKLPDSYASTTGYTATIAALGMIAEAWDGGTIDPSWSELPTKFRALEREIATRAVALATPLRDAVAVDYAGAAPSAGTAEVGALLLREVARLPATGLSSRQYLHGAMESAGRTAHILLGDERETALAHTLAHAGHHTLLITTLEVAEEPNLAVLRLPEVSPAQRAILEALVMQSLAVETALLRGVDPDAFVFFHTDTKVA
ncbi:SIS domain-containing protein [Devosia insulae DS-56]|uniref:Glutamine--fructose-6-phosphate aminotransferase [isomerizing] n=1 Tax=Devosia insulae DS-56 TaxID=1116389 RepID=A0A1E5XSB2_9HYPH|nr:SIS domain-containing protein [Devosia insulae]OEO31497.1 SIS domain-containing protein [Devosia insulae DS-56]